MGHNHHGLLLVHQSHPGFMHLAYILLLPIGDDGWCQGIAMQNPGTREKLITVEQQPWYRYHLHHWAGQFSSLFFARKLFQQYLVDAWEMCGLNKLEYFRNN
jgi:hypothetical protein